MKYVRGTVAIVLLCGLAGSARAEVSAIPRSDGRVDTMVMGDVGITDGVDPIPQIWQDHRSLPADWILNADGVLRGDGRPDLFIRPSSWPIVVWAFQKEGQHDIAISFWQDNGWGPIEFLTDTQEDELDPRVFAEGDGTVHVVWWVNGPEPRVELQTRHDNAAPWLARQQVTPLNEPGRRPSVAVFEESLWVAYERDAPQTPFNLQEVALRRMIAGDTFALEYVAETEWTGAANPILNVRNQAFWMDWRFGENQFAYARLSDLGGDETNVEVWNDLSWIGIENVRRILGTLIGTNPTDPDVGPPMQIP